LLVVDNTFMSPALQSPLKLGADICLHSITKYIGGHSDVLGGALMFNTEDLFDRLHFNIKSIGTMMAPFDAWIAFRGCKTVKLRVMKSTENALEVAKWLEKHAKVEKVLYPGLPSHPHHKVALKNRADKKLCGGSGMLGFYIKGDINKTNKFLSSLKLITLAESLGGVESLIESPALMTHGSVPPEVRLQVGIHDNYCRFSTGIEEVEDIIADLKQALAKI
jgi:cystathionine gamma-lyase